MRIPYILDEQSDITDRIMKAINKQLSAKHIIN